MRSVRSSVMTWVWWQVSQMTVLRMAQSKLPSTVLKVLFSGEKRRESGGKGWKVTENEAKSDTKNDAKRHKNDTKMSQNSTKMTLK